MSKYLVKEKEDLLEENERLKRQLSVAVEALKRCLDQGWEGGWDEQAVYVQTILSKIKDLEQINAEGEL